MNDHQSPDVVGFWAWFAGEADGLAATVSGEGQARITTLMDEALARFRLPITYEVSAGESGPELVFTAEGDRERAEFLKKVVEQAPKTVWSIHPLRPRRPLDAALAIVHAVHGLDLAPARFQARVVDGMFHLRFLSDELFRLDDKVRHDAAALFLDYALGEELATATVAGLDFQPSGEGISMALMVNELIRKAQSIEKLNDDDARATR